MSSSSSDRARWTWKRLAILVLALFPVVLGILLGAYWLRDHVAPGTAWRWALALLVGLEAGYPVLLILVAVLVPFLGFRLLRSRRARSRSVRTARGLALTASILVSLIAIEVASAAWLARRSHLVSPVPAAERQSRTTTLPDPPEAVTLPTDFPDPPDDQVVDLVVLGESSAEGVPYNDFGISVGKIVALELQDRFPDRRFQVEMLASSGQTLEMQHARLQELRRRPDLLLIYCGHNEFSARIPWSRDRIYYLDDQQPSLWERIQVTLERVSPFCRLVGRTAENCRVRIPPRPGGERALVDVPAYTETEAAALLDDFQRRLDRIVAYAGRIGAVPILIVPPASDSGFEPNRSYLAPTTPRADREAFARSFLDARKLEQTEPAQAITAYRALLARQPGFAEAHYRLARLLERRGAWDEVYREDLLARDLDGYPMRCLSTFQQVYRDVAARHGCILIDGQAYFHQIGRHGLLDDHLFQDAMHPSLRGQIALAQAVLSELRDRRLFGWPSSDPPPRLDPARLVARLNMGRFEWWRVCIWGIMFYDLTAPMRYDPSVRRARQEEYGSAVNRMEAGAAPEALGLPNIGTPAPLLSSDDLGDGRADPQAGS